MHGLILWFIKFNLFENWYKYAFVVQMRCVM